MANKEKIEEDFKKFNLNIEREAENELKKIQEESNALKEDAKKIGAAVENSLKKTTRRYLRKKVNT